MAKKQSPVVTRAKAEVAVSRSTPDMLLEMAMQKDLDLEKLERLIKMKEEFEAKEARKSFYNALSKFQSIVPDILKEKKGYDNSYKYAPLNKIVKAIKAPLYECGFSYQFTFKDILKDEIPELTFAKVIEAIKGFDFYKNKPSVLEKVLREVLSNKDIEVTCIVTHIDGYAIECTMKGPEDFSGFKNAIQSRGSTTQYLERYTLIGALGLVTADTDTDGAGVVSKKGVASGKPVLTNAQMTNLINMVLAGKKTLKECKENAELTDDQHSALEIAEDTFKKKKE